MSETTALTAKYIWDNRDEWLDMALHIYEAMPDIRLFLVEQIMKDLAGKVKESVADIEGGNFYWEDPAYGINFWSSETGEFSVCVEVEVVGSRGPRKLQPRIALHVGKNLRKINKEARLEILESFDKVVGQSESSGNYIAIHYVVDDRVPGDWNGNYFLRQAVRNGEEIVSCLVDLAVRTYNDLHDDMKRIAKAAWG